MSEETPEAVLEVSQADAEAFAPAFERIRAAWPAYRASCAGPRRPGRRNAGRVLRPAAR